MIEKCNFMMMNVRHVIIMLSICFALMHASVGTDWDCFKGTSERTSSSDTPAPDTLYVLWKAEIGSPLYASPVVKNGKVFQAAMDEIVCIDFDTGDVMWTSSVPTYYSTPAISNDKIIVTTNRGISALSVENGNTVWEYIVSGRFMKRFSLDDYIVSSPAILDEMIVVGTRPYSVPIPENIYFGKQDQLFLVCLDENTGEEKWHVGTTIGVFSSPCIINGRVFAASREILCIDSERGKVLWNSEDRYSFDPFNSEKTQRERYAFDYSTPALYHGILVGGSSFMGWQKIVAMDQYTGDIFWEWVEEGALASSPALCEGRIYFYSYDGLVRCLSLLDGKELWRTLISEQREFKLKEFKLWPSSSVTDGKVYIGSIDGIFYCLDAYTGQILWEYKTAGPIHSTPAIASEKVLISSTDGCVYCFGTDPGTHMMKAQEYFGNGKYDKAEEFLMKARKYAETGEDIEEIDGLLDLVNLEMEEYQYKLDKLSEAESFMDEADKILWSKEFGEAQSLYTKARKIYEELDDEFGVFFCESKTSYLEKRIMHQEKLTCYVFCILVILIFAAIAFIILLKKSHRLKSGFFSLQ